MIAPRTIEFDASGMVGIDLVDHILKFCLSGILTELSHDHTELIGRYRAGVVLIEEVEHIAE